MSKVSIHLRVQPEQRDLIDRAASALGKNRSDFVLEAACERAQAALMDQSCFNLDEDRFSQFTAMLDAPVEQNPGLERLMAVRAPWDADAE